MKAIRFLAWLSLSMVLSACAVVTTAGDIAQGRQAMLEGNYQLALDYFWTGDQIDPNYTYGAELRERGLSFLGRAQYLTGNYAQARQTLEKDLSHHRSDNVARLYLGLTLVRLGGLQEGGQIPTRYEWNSQPARLLERGLSLRVWPRLRPGGTIERHQSDLDMIASADQSRALIADGENLGDRD